MTRGELESKLMPHVRRMGVPSMLRLIWERYRRYKIATLKLEEMEDLVAHLEKTHGSTE